MTGARKRGVASGRRRGRAAVVLALAGIGASASLAAPAAFAQSPAPLAATPARRVVEVLVAGGAADGASIEETVRELLGRLTLVTESREVGHVDEADPDFRGTARPSLLARVGVDLRDRDAVQILVVDGRTGDVVLRRSVRRDGPAAVVREEVAHVVQSAIDPLILVERDRAAAPPVPPPPAPAPAPPPPVASEPASPPRTEAEHPARPAPTPGGSPLSLDVVTEAGAGSYAPGSGLIARAGGGAALVYRRGVRPGIGLFAHYVFPFETGDTTASAHINVVSIRALPQIEVYGNRTVAFDVLAGGGLDVLHVEPRTSELPAELLGPEVTRVSPLFTAGVNAHLAISGGTSVTLMLGADLDPTSRAWVVDQNGSRTSAFAPSHVRAVAMLGFSFAAFGDARFGGPGAAR